ncbi:iron ABC transporter permease [Alteromonas sp. ASW11-36]|uniref:Iron ABC transporter permease n=1 Tax=Alteromonas arenosi TaxID=3055817 RepID=A0ABT7SUQ3_9ALTE|nr:iron ABC transporter permease [Alteromonas sp. ASW11-36]MDM7859911.1 iron ABC transporter permease [Alteromonas sp. ASW11-36]
MTTNFVLTSTSSTTKPLRVIVALAVLVLLLFAAVLVHLKMTLANAHAFEHVMWQLTLPTLVTAFLVGAALAVSAGCLQVLLQNPLADPGIIGISSGASLMAAAVLLSGFGAGFLAVQYWLPLASFIGALVSTFIIIKIAARLQHSPVAVILAGIAISTLSGAIIAWLYYFADAQAMRNLTFWLMGSLYQSDPKVLLIGAPILLFAIGFILGKTTQLNQLYLGANNAIAAGVNVQALQKRLLIACALAVGCAVSLAGSIAFIGLLVPHFLRFMIGYDNRWLIPASALLGGALLLLVVLVTEVWAVTTLPVSMLTASIGGPIFIWALLRGQFRPAGGR